MPPKDCRFGDPEEYRSTFKISEGVILPGFPVIKNQGIDCNYLVASGP